MIHQSMFVLAGRALLSLWRNALFYTGVAVASIALEAAVIFGWHAREAMPLAQLLVPPLVTTLCYAVTYAEVAPLSPAAMWSRALERCWAVIGIDVVTAYFAAIGVAVLGAGGLLDRISAILLLLAAISLVFADVAAVVDDDDDWLLLLPRAIFTSVRTAWSGATMWRVIVLFALELVPLFAGNSLQSFLEARHVAGAAFWANVPLGTILAIPLSILTVLVFLDATGYESKRTCDE